MLVVAGTLGLPTTAATAFEVRCHILNPITGQPAARFRPGDDLAVRVQLDIPADATSERITASISARAKVRGVRFSTQIIEFDLRAPEMADRIGIAGIEEIEDELDRGITLDETRTIRLPGELPDGKVTLKVGITIPAHGTKNCRTDGEIRR